MAKRFLFMFNNPPYSGIYAQEMLDIVLTAAAFDQKVTLLLLDDGVFQLKRGQQPEQYRLKDTSALFRALEVYDVNEIYVEQESLRERNLSADNLVLPVKTVARDRVSGFIANFDVVFSV
ncbi:MAG: sulfurtransferase complex subunit TusC [Methylobacter sp.]|nr:MAG: sulfurtransferase complex subunit TusC [Methylobacter sp.]PPD05266.1 MAG: sulfurtransferase complex subunit TusC [Methylobacter sp.]